MKAPTNVYGPDGSLCRKGDPIPAGWFGELPDLAKHLDACERNPDPSSTDPTPTATEVTPKNVRAKATVGRTRGSSS